MGVGYKNGLANKKIFEISVANVNSEKKNDQGHESNQATTFKYTSQRETCKLDKKVHDCFLNRQF